MSRIQYLYRLISIGIAFALVFAGLAVMNPPRPVWASGWVVNTLTDAVNGSCTTACTLRDAMTLALSGDAITFAVSGTITLGSTLPAVAKTLTIDGTGQNVIISGNNAVQIMVVSAGGDLSLNALMLNNGNGDAGGAISNTGTLNVTNSTFADNTTGQIRNEGGAIYNESGIMNVTNSTFSGNTADLGGLYESGGLGGAIYNASGTLNITNSTFSGNTANGRGCVSGSDCIGNNGSGGAISNSGTLNAANSTFAANIALGQTLGTPSGIGGAVSNYGTLNVVNSTFSGNVAGDFTDGAIFNGVGTATLNNSIMSNNTGGDCAAGSGSLNGTDNLSDGSCPGTNAAATDVSVTLTSNGGPTQTFALLGGSNAIDAVPSGMCVYVSSGTNPLFTNGAPITIDQRGISRPQGALCDIGSYEFVHPDRLDTIGIFRRTLSNGTFLLRLHNSTGYADLTVAFTHGSKPYPVVGDWTGSGYDTVGSFDQSNGLFTLCAANDTTSCANSSNQISFVLGNPNDMPLGGKWSNGFTHFGVGVFRPSNGLIYLKNNLTTGYADDTMVLGIPGDTGLAGDWNGDGLDSPGVYRPSTQKFYLNDQICNCSDYATYTFQYGVSGDAPVVGDWIGQGHDGVGLFRQSNGYTYLRNSLSTGFADITFTYGIANDVPVAGHWQLVYPPAPMTEGNTARNPGSVLVPPTLAPLSTAKASQGGGLGD